MDRSFFTRSSRNNQSKQKETNGNEQVIKKRKEPLCNVELDDNISNPVISSAAKRIVSNVMMKHIKQTTTTIMGQQSTPSCSILGDITNRSGTTVVNSSTTQLTSNVGKENMFQQSTNTAGECSQNISTPAPKTPTLRLGTPSLTNSDQKESTSDSVSRDARTKRTSYYRERRKNITPIDFDIEEPNSNDLQKPSFKGISNEYVDDGDLTYVCSACGAKLWLKETKRGKLSQGLAGALSICCQKGKIALPAFTKPPPKLIWDLYTNNHPKSKHFLENVRQYNMIFAFTSMGGKVDNQANSNRGPYTFRISGQNCHQYGGLLPNHGHKPRFGQLYIYDTTNEPNNRKEAISGKKKTKSTSSRYSLDEDLIVEIIKVLDEHNPLVKTFRMARDRFKEFPNMQLKIKLIGRRTKDGRNYNLPTVDEVAALIVGDINVSSFDERDILIDSHVEGLKRISELHPEYLALQYPLLFIYAEDGYRTDILHRDVYEHTTRKKKRVTMREYFAYKLQERAVPTLVHLGRKLYQQFVVDAYTMIEAERISYIRKNQNILRADTFNNLRNATLSGDVVNSDMGNMIKLPSSFTGSARYMIENYRDAMALCRVFGYPDLFLTFTCNPKWPEITRELDGTGFKPEDKPSLCARMFKMKLDQLMKDIRKKKIFGTLKAEVYTVEFQKRGLPHAHICLFLDERSKMPEPQDVDKYICAEIPDQINEPELYQLVSDLMIHGPCGDKNPSCPCTDTETKKCTKRFPKPFSDVTKTDQDGYPIYRRRNDGRTVTKQGHDLDNSCVVAYNPQLLKMYQAHLNVEWCNQIGSIRYLFKYINKGNDKITAHICDQETDEIQLYYDCRYVSSCEAMWRIFSFDIHHHGPSVIRLPFHLEGEHQIIFDEDEIIEDVLEKPSVNTSMFLEWMKCNVVNQQARELTYVDFPTKFIWDKDNRVWRARKNKTGAIGRIHHVAPASGDLFYLRILLNKVRGPTSYEAIRTVNGILFDNFKDACYDLGLLDDDNEYIEAIKEAFFGEGGHFVRTLFAQLLLSNTMSRPEEVFDKTFEFLSADVVHPNRPGTKIPIDLLKDLTLQEIERLLQRNSSSLRSFSSMPFPSYNTRDLSENHLIIDELSYDKRTLEVEHSDFITKLTTEQKDAYDQIMKAVHKGTGDVFFLYGYGGTGKTFLWKTLTAALRSKGEIVLNVASSGIAALLLSGGRTAHSRFRIPLHPTDESFCTITPDSNLAELIRRAKLIIWDEAPMVNKMCVEALDRSLRDICRQVNPHSMDTIFGGKILVFGGDFRQILPVIQKGTRQDIVGASLNSSYLWDHVTVLKLTVNMRLCGLSTSSSDADTKRFAEWILEIGNGNVGESEDGVFDIEIPQDLLITDSVDPIGSMISTIYPEYLLNLSNPIYYQQRAILAPTHEVVDIINDRMKLCLEGEERSYLSSDSICASQRDNDFNADLYNTDFLNSIEVGGLPKHNLRLKVGVPVMLLRNVDQAGGLCNGTRLQVLELGERIIKAKILTGSNVGKITAISRMLIVPTDKRIPFRFQRRQYPLSVCFAMTINKSQGQSLEHVGLFLTKPVFSHGQLYVALSRVTNRQGLKILILDKDNKICNTTKNVVFKEVLQHL